MIGEIEAIAAKYGVTAGYVVIEIESPHADGKTGLFHCLMGMKGISKSKILSILAKNTFELLQQIAHVDLSQLNEN